MSKHQCSVVGCKSRETSDKWMHHEGVALMFRFCEKHVRLPFVGVALARQYDDWVA